MLKASLICRTYQHYRRQ